MLSDCELDFVDRLDSTCAYTYVHFHGGDDLLSLLHAAFIHAGRDHIVTELKLQQPVHCYKTNKTENAAASPLLQNRQN